MKIKENVQMIGLQMSMKYPMEAAAKIWEENGQELVITRGTEYAENSSAGSYHYFGHALDFRTSYFDDVTKQRVYEELSEVLGAQFRVLIKPTHIHVQINPQAQQ
jgi:biotin synthase-like enzyme